MQYGKHALDMLASSQDSLRLGWLEQLFSSAADSDDLEEDVEGLRLQLAVKLIRSVNPGVGGGKVELRFKELQRVRTSMSGLTLENESGAKDPGENKRPIGRNERVTKQDFIKVFHDFCTRPEIYFLLVQFSSNKEFLDTKDLMRFLEAEQGMAQVGNANESRLLIAGNKSGIHKCNLIHSCSACSLQKGLIALPSVGLLAVLLRTTDPLDTSLPWGPQQYPCEVDWMNGS